MKDDYYLKNISNKLKFITLMPKYICKVLLEGSIDASYVLFCSYDENTSILDDVFKYIDSTKRLILSKN